MIRVLVVDDEPDVRDLIVRWLRRDGHDVLASGSGAGALAAVEQHGMPDVALLDVAMPGMDGITLLTELRRRDPGLAAMFVTALWTPADMNRIRETGADHLAKPFTVTVLGHAVRRLAPGAGQ
ncbi:response regulator [Actinoplanes derwentensis]|uniref:response regulator n=1 Tax=Actinoplanes derwentensis TaxID=113562 RepID=UPI0012FDBCEE|nr:response regulator [Actinoplanes derwentensis]